MKWIWAGGKGATGPYNKAGPSRFGLNATPASGLQLDMIIHSLECLGLVIQLGIRGPLRHECFASLRGSIARAGALRAVHIAFVRSQFSDASNSDMPFDSTSIQPQLTTIPMDARNTGPIPLSVLELEFYPRFAHDLVILIMARDVQIPLTANDYPPLAISLSRALHNKELIPRLEAQQASQPLSYSQLDILINYTAPESHSLLRRTVCGDLVRLLETQRTGMTYWDWALKRGWGPQMRRARKERGAWLIRKYNEEISQSGGRMDKNGKWQRAFRVHRDFWKPVYEAEREVRGDVKPVAKTPEDGQ